MAKLLVEYKAEVNSADISGWTPLLLAAANGNVELIKFLLENSVDNINYKFSGRGNTALTLTSHQGHVEAVKVLISYGADVNLMAAGGWGPIQYANKSEEITRILLENKADINQLSSGPTALILAAGNNRLDVLKTLISFNPDLELECQNGDEDDENSWRGLTALSTACWGGNPEAVKMLLEAGAVSVFPLLD